MRISDWSSDVCSSDLGLIRACGADRVDLRSERGDLAGTGGVGRVCLPLRALVEARPHLFHELVQLMEIYIGDQGRDNHALRCSAIVPLELPVVNAAGIEHCTEKADEKRIID